MTEAREVYVEVVRRSDQHVERRIGPMSERKADRVERGVEINLNHQDYLVRVTPA